MADVLYDVTFDISIPGAIARTLTRQVTAPSLEEAIEVAKTQLVIIKLKAVKEAVVP